MEKLCLPQDSYSRTRTCLALHPIGSWQHGFEIFKKCGVQFHEGVPDRNLLRKWFPEGDILVLDDLMNEGSSDKNFLDLFTKDSHHQQITVIYLCQDLFPTGKFVKTISCNAQYIVAFKNPRDQLGLRNLLQQSYPTQFREVLNTFRQVPDQRPFAYMVLDLHPASRDDQRILCVVISFANNMVNAKRKRRQRRRKQRGGALP